MGKKIIINLKIKNYGKNEDFSNYDGIEFIHTFFVLSGFNFF